MTMPTLVVAKSARVTIAVPATCFPVSAIPAKGLPGSAKARLKLVFRTEAGVEITAEPTARAMQQALAAALSRPGGHWVAQGRLGPGGSLLDGGVVYQPPKAAPLSSQNP